MSVRLCKHKLACEHCGTYGDVLSIYLEKSNKKGFLEGFYPNLLIHLCPDCINQFKKVLKSSLRRKKMVFKCCQTCCYYQGKISSQNYYGVCQKKIAIYGTTYYEVCNYWKKRIIRKNKNAE